MNKKEGGKSHRGRRREKICHRLSPIYYTSIAIFKDFDQDRSRSKNRHQREETKGRNKKNNIIDSQAGQRRNPQRPCARSQSHERPPDPARNSTMIKPWLEAAIALEFDTASKLLEPVLTGPHARLSPLALCRNMSRSCISARPFRQITAPVTVRNFFCCRNSVSQTPKPECSATTA